MRRSLSIVSFAVALAPTVALAQSHDLRGMVTPQGLDFIAEQVPSYVPKHLSPPDASKDLLCVTAVQRDTEIDLHVDGFALSIPQPGRINLDLTMTINGTGELFAEDVVACLGDLTCQETFGAAGLRAIVDLDVGLVDGVPRVAMVGVDVQLDADDLTIAFSDCLAGDLVTWVIDFAKGWVIDYVIEFVEVAAEELIAPKIEKMLGSVAYSGSIGSVKFQAALDDLAIDAAGIALGATFDVSTPYPADECVAAYDHGEPLDLAGDAPDLTTGKPAHLALAANLGLVNDALYHAWRSGLMCLTEEHLAALGVALPLDMVADLLPGFPPGTTMGIEILLKNPISIKGVADDAATLTVHLEDLEVALTGQLPDGTERRITVTASAEATAAVGIDPGSNALIGQLIAVKLDKLEIDQLSASEYGFDVDRIKYVVEKVAIPHAMETMGQMPLTGPVFAAADYAVILRDLGTTEAYLSVKTDLFRIPSDDADAPDTSLSRFPQKLVSPADAIIGVSGLDARIPIELLQYEVKVDGVARLPTFIREFKVGRIGESATYEVSVAAKDLSGNVDGSPATLSVMVDGRPPQLILKGDRIRRDEGTIDLAWTVTDDLTSADQLGVRVEVYEVIDPTDLLSVEMIDSKVLPPGTMATAVEGLPADRLYRIELHSTDSVGNEAGSSVLIDLRSGGCRAGGGASGAATLLVALGLAMMILRRRR